MSFSKYLSSKRSYIVAIVVTVLALSGVLLYLGLNFYFLCLLDFCIVICLAAPLVLEFQKFRDFYNSLIEYSESLTPTSDVFSQVRDPRDELQEVIYDFVIAYDKSCKQISAEAKLQAEDYCSYIESWVHEIKTPLSASVLIANRLNTPDKSELMNQFELINQELEEVLWYARSNSVNKDYRIRAVSLYDMIGKVCKKNARYLIEMGATPSLDIKRDMQVYCDEKWTSFIITQAVVNSAKYHAKSIVFSTEDKGIESFDKKIVLHIKDDGDGIPESDLPYVFEPAFVGNRGRENATSTGMGLYLSAKMCEKLGIGITISSQEKVGTSLSLEFPFDETILQICNKSVR